MASGKRVAALLPELPPGVTDVSQIRSGDLRPEHFGASPEDVDGWRTMPKRTLKRAVEQARYARFAA